MSLTSDTLPTPTTSFAVPAPPTPVLPLQPTSTAAPALEAGSVSLEKVQEDDNDSDLESMDVSPHGSPVLHEDNLFSEMIPPMSQDRNAIALPMSVKDFYKLEFAKLNDDHLEYDAAAESGEEDVDDEVDEDDELVVDLLGPHPFTFPFEDQLVYATFWQGVYISHHLCKLLEQLMQAKEQPSLTFARVLLLDLLICFSENGVFDSVCYNSVKGFKQKTADGTLVAAWCLHCPMCSEFISCSSFVNVQTHIMFKHWTETEKSFLDSYFDCKNACSQAGIDWPCALEPSFIDLESPQSVLETWEVLASFDFFLSPSCFERLFDKSPFFAAFAFSLVFVWRYCFNDRFGPYLKETRQNAVGVTAVGNKSKKRRKRR